MEVMVTEIEDIESINNLISHVKTAIQCEAFKETLAIVDLNSIEEGVVQLYIDLICNLALGVEPRTVVTCRPRSSSDDSISTDDTIVGEKSRARSKIMIVLDMMI